MAVPGFQEMFLPYLQCLHDGEPHTNAQITNFVIEALQVSKEDQNEMLPSGQSTKVSNRVGWCRTHLNKAGLIEREDWGVYKISDTGKQLIANPPAKLNLKFLDTIPQHKAWFHAPKKTKLKNKTKEAVESQPPNERIEEAFTEFNDSLSSELLAQMSEMDPFKFEQVVIDLLFAMGYGGSRAEAAQVTKKSNDEGIDGVINQDRLGLDVIYVQAKRWQGNVGRKEIQSFVGALAGKQANKGVFITTSDFVQNATDYAESVSQKVILINGDRLAELMIEHNIGVSTVRTVALKRIDSDYFED